MSLEEIDLKLFINEFDKNSTVSEKLYKSEFYIESLDDIEIEDKVYVVFKAHKKEGKVFVTGEYETVVVCECVRCLEKLKFKLKNKFDAVFVDTVEYNSYLKQFGKENEMNRGEIYDEVINGVIDLKELIRERILLDLPFYPRCSDDCQNSELDKYIGEDIDFRWQQLLNIKN